MATTKSKAKASPGDTTQVCLVLDRSGSMQAVRSDALGSVNDYIEAAQKDAALKLSRFSLVTFNSTSIDPVRSNEAMAKVKAVAAEEYICNGWTPLYDAVARGIGLLDEALSKGKASRKKTSKAILVVMTDGQENASVEFRGDFGRSRVKQMIKEREAEGWLVTFLGEGLDVAAQGLNIGTQSANTAAYHPKNLRAVGEVLASSNARYAATQSFDEQLSMASAGLTAQERRKLGVTSQVVSSKPAKRK